MSAMRSPSRLALCATLAGSALALSACGDDEPAGTASQQTAAPASTAPAPTTTATTPRERTRRRKEREGSTAPERTATTPQRPVPLDSDEGKAALAAGEAACEGKSPKEVVDAYIAAARENLPTGGGARVEQARRLLETFARVPEGAEASKGAAQMAAAVYALSVDEIRLRGAAFNGCTTALGGTPYVPPKTKTTG